MSEIAHVTHRTHVVVLCGRLLQDGGFNAARSISALSHLLLQLYFFIFSL